MPDWVGIHTLNKKKQKTKKKRITKKHSGKKEREDKNNEFETAKHKARSVAFWYSVFAAITRTLQNS